VTFRLIFTDEATQQLAALEKDLGLQKRLKAVRKALGLMETNLRHPGLNTHEHGSLSKSIGEKVFESYAESKTPAAYRIFWMYGPGKNVITVISITPHP
jgi:hypothetical protein